MNKEIIEFANKEKRSIKEIMEKFKIPVEQKFTLRKRLKENNVVLKETRGRKKIEF